MVVGISKIHGLSFNVMKQKLGVVLVLLALMITACGANPVEYLFTGTPHTIDVARVEDENGRFAYYDVLVNT